jgi:hypothetical protein
MRWDSVAKGLFGTLKKYVEEQDTDVGGVFHKNVNIFALQFSNRKNNRIKATLILELKQLEKVSKSKASNSLFKKSCKKFDCFSMWSLFAIYHFKSSAKKVPSLKVIFFAMFVLKNK